MFDKYADKIAEAVMVTGNITVTIIQEMIALHALKKFDMLNKYERYKASDVGVPIHTRVLPVESNKINNKLANDYFSEIIDTKVGYMFGIPIINQLDKSMISGGAQAYDNLAIEIQRFRKVNSMDDMNAEMCKFSAMCGYDAALAYIDTDGRERVMRVDPWEAMIVSRTEITEPQYAVRYFTTWADKLRVEFYDDTNRHTFESGTGNSSGLAWVKTEGHMFDYCPMWGIPNNAEMQGDGDKVISLIDAYDRSMSDMNSEIEQFRLAYMIFYGVEPDEELVEGMRTTGALHVPATEKDESPNNITFLTKQINHAAVDSHLDRIEANITRFAKHVNFTDQAFAGNLSGVAMKYKLFALETKAKYFERKHDAATLYMFKVITSAWKRKGMALDWTTLENKYTRNVAINLVDEANSAVALLGVISRRTAISTLSFVPDVDKELEELEREKGETGMVDLDEPIVDEDTNEDGTPKTDEQKAAEAAEAARIAAEEAKKQTEE